MRRTGLALLVTGVVLGVGGTSAWAAEGCPERKLNVSGSSDSDKYTIPALEVGETHEGRDVSGHAVAASCTAEGLEVKVDGRLVVIFSEDQMRVPSHDGKEVVIHTKDEDRRHIVVSTRDEKDITIDIREDGLVLLGGPDGRVLELTLDKDEKSLTLKVEE